jgi:transposase InsO family protein
MKMPWKGQTMEERREEFVRRALELEKSKSELCREYGISRPTGDKWIKRHRRGEGMTDRSRSPMHVPGRTNAETEAAIVAIRQKHPALGAKKIKRLLENKGEYAPAHSTINTILHRHGLITKEASLSATPKIRFEREFPNEMWQTDFKGHFAMRDKTRCHPLAVLDDHSRFCLCLDAKDNERYEGVQKSFLAAFEQYGLPQTLLCDNGNPWGTAQSTGYTLFEVWLMDLGILTKHGRIRHPQTQGKEERFNGTLLRERLRYREYIDLSHAQQDFDEYRQFYNQERPHHALDLQTPADRYYASKRKLPGKISEWDYGQQAELRQIKSSGYLTFRGQGYFLSEAFRGRTVSVTESNDEKGVFLVIYRQFCVATLNIDNRVVLARKALLYHPLLRSIV